MNNSDLTICREIHTGLTSKERNNINYLFLDPVDTNIFPQYKQVIKKPMDLRTLKSNLESTTPSIYTTKEEFYADAKLIFTNAIEFNKDRDSKFVVDLANRMMKAFDRLRKNSEKKQARLLLAAAEGGTGSSDGNKKRPSLPTKSNRAASTSNLSTTVDGQQKKKISIKFKRQKSTSSIGGGASSTASDNDTDNEPIGNKKKGGGTKLKLKLSTAASAAVGGSDTSSANKGKSKSTSTLPTSSDCQPGAAGIQMNPYRRAQAYKVISSLKRRQPSACKWFAKPVSDPQIVKDYREKIINPMDLSTISNKLDKNTYKTILEFIYDLRLIASNCLQYNTTVHDSFRPVATDFLKCSEELCKYFISKTELPNKINPPILYCWDDCIKVITEVVNMTNVEDKHQTAWFFLHPVTYYIAGQYPEGYLDLIHHPIDFGTIVQNLIGGKYKTVLEFANDCRLVATNCKTFYNGKLEGKELIEKAKRLDMAMEKTLSMLLKLDAKNGTKAREKANKKYIVIKRPEKDFLKSIMTELRVATYTDKSAKITEKATLHFEKPVDTSIFTDYLKFVDTPMDLETVDRKIESGSYITPEDFEYDVLLIFKNCERYNGPKKNIHMVTLGKYTAKLFRKMFAERLRGGPTVAKRPSLPTSANRVSDGTSIKMGGGKIGGGKRPASPSVDDRPTKRVSIKGPSSSMSSSTSTNQKKKSNFVAPKSHSPSRITISDPNAPLPMHVAIAKIKEKYPGRRRDKDLEGWEAECVKFLGQLMKHTWINAERPKYIFHVPVPLLFPALKVDYATKIKNPMDLTTAEAKLLQGGLYQNAEEFIADIALVFSNATAFNKDGNDVGDQLSCAYYEASTHLLKYVRWLSLDVLKTSLVDCLNSPVVESGSASSWKLTIRNRDMSRKELEQDVFNELMDKTEPGDTHYSELEKECEKLLKSLRHTSDNKHMHWFVPNQFPVDYTSYISKPISWEDCHNNLKERRYNTIGEIISDLRLIFTNALKYNNTARHVSPTSKSAYDGAVYMSRKLEAAIDKMLLIVGDKIGRERIDMITSHREMVAKEEAEEKERKAQWEKEHPGESAEVKMKLTIRRSSSHHRRSLTDFELPFYDKDDDQVESDADWLAHAKSLYEKQREARANCQQIALSISNSVHRKHQESAAAKAWCNEMAHKRQVERIRLEKEKEEAEAKKKEEEQSKQPEVAKPMGVPSADHDGWYDIEKPQVSKPASDDGKMKEIKISKLSVSKPKKLKRKLTSLE